MGKPDGKGGGRTAADPRFAAMHNDPRFQRFPKQKNKIVVDKRFAGMFEDPEFQTRSAVDKRGRKIEDRSRNEDLRRYYRLRDEDEWRQEGDGAAAEADIETGAEDDGAAHQQQQQEGPDSGQTAAAPKGQKKAAKAKGDTEKPVPKPAAVEGGDDADRAADQAALPKQQKQQKQKQPQAKHKQQESAAAAMALERGPRQRGGAPEAVTAAAVAAAGVSTGAGVRGKGKTEGGARAASVARRKPSSDDEEEEEEEGGSDAEGTRGSEDGEEEEEDEAEGDEEAKAQERWARARGVLVSDSSDDEADGEGDEGEYDSADEALSDEEYESEDQLDPEEWGAGALALNPEEPIPLQDETRRLALVDLDWDHVRAVDILVVLRSFLPRGSNLERVTVYPSDYGLQRMADEAAMGPKLILKPTKPGATPAPAAMAATMKAGGKGVQQRQRKGAADDDSGAEVDKKRLAAYEKSRLRYYYAVVECDCIAAALQLYNECDGMEFERSACKFDMRFVPDDQSFEGRQIRDSATEVPPGYEPPAQFNISLQHTDPKLSWDAEDPERKRKLQGRRLKTDDDVLEADFAAYLGSDEEEDDEEEAAEAGPGGVDGVRRAGGSGAGSRGGEDAEALRQRYRALLLGEGGGGGDDAGKAGDGAKTKGRVGGKSWLGSEDGEEDEEEDDDGAQGRDRRGGVGAGEPSTSAAAVGRRGGRGAKGDMDMVVTFHSGLEGLGERLKKKKEEERARAGETVWEAYLRKKGEKRAQRKAQGRFRNLSDSEDSHDYISGDEEGDGGDGRAASNAKGKANAKGAKKARKDVEEDGEDDLYGDVGSDDPFFKQDDGDDPFADPFFNQDGGGGAAAGKMDSSDDGDDGDDGKGRRAAAKNRKGSEKDKKKGTKKGTEKAGSQAAERADLELLLMDDAALREAAKGVKTQVLPAGHDLGADGGKRNLTKKEKRELKKEAKRRARAGSDEEDAAAGGEEAAPGFAVDLADPRFGAMFRSADFALDPTDPRFKKMQARDKMLTEVQKLRSQQQEQEEEGRKEKQQNGGGGAGAAGDELQRREAGQAGSSGGELGMMVAKLKRKAEAQQEKQRAQVGKGPKKTRM